MAQIDGDWTYRAAITVQLASWSSGAIDIEVTVPKAWDLFWDRLDSSGNEIRVCDADGYTLLSYDLSGTFNLSTRTMVIQIDSWTPPTGAEDVALLWLYFGNSGAADASTSVTITSAYTGSIELTQPRPDRTIVAAPPAPGADPARIEMAKESDVTTYFWVDVSNYLHKYRSLENKSLASEEVAYANWTIESSGTPVGTMVENDSQRFVEFNGKTYVACLAKAGSAGTTYLAKLKFGTTQAAGLSQVEVAKFRLTVQNVDEA